MAVLSHNWMASTQTHQPKEDIVDWHYWVAQGCILLRRNQSFAYEHIEHTVPKRQERSQPTWPDVKIFVILQRPECWSSRHGVQEKGTSWAEPRIIAQGSFSFWISELVNDARS